MFGERPVGEASPARAKASAASAHLPRLPPTRLPQCQARTTKLTRDRAVRNADLGIETVRGVIDGGGNIARHNGDPRQCTNIVCH